MKYIINILNDFSAKNTKQKCIYFNINNALPGRLYVCMYICFTVLQSLHDTNFFSCVNYFNEKEANQLTLTEKIQLQFF